MSILMSIFEMGRLFSKLKLIKNYLRSTMSQERLSTLEILAIERDIASNIKYDNLTDQFTVEKCTKLVFYIFVKE
jgi:hypothetical protein